MPTTQLLPLLVAILVLPAFHFLHAQTDEFRPSPADSLLSIEVSNINGHPNRDSVYTAVFAWLDRAKAGGDPIEEGEVYRRLARMYNADREEGDVETVINYYQQMLGAFQRTRDSARIADAHYQLCFTLIQQGNTYEAEPHCLTALRYFKNSGDANMAQAASLSVANIYMQEEDYEQAEMWAKEGMKQALVMDDSVDICSSYAYLSEIAYKAGDYQESLELAEESLRIATAYEPTSVIILISRYVQRGNALLALGRAEEAMEDFQFAWGTVRDEAPSPEYANGWVNNIGKVHHFRGEYEKAIPLFRDYLAYLKGKPVAAIDYLQIEKLLADSYDKTNQIDSAYTAHQRAAAHELEMTEGQLAGLKKELRVKYETDEKNATIATQESSLAQRRRVQNLTYGILGLALLGLVGLFFGLRNNRRKNERLALQNDQNELLLKEIHHRVKNNLETVSSLLELQSASLTDEHAVAAMQAGQSRVQSMGLLHQKLYQGKNLAAIEMRDYFKNLAESLRETYEPGDHIDIDIDMEPVELDIDTAVPLGLIVNELLTNTLKYAFEGAAAGAVKVGLNQTAHKEYHLTVWDDGQGKDFAAKASGTGFGTRLVQLLTRQLGGDLTETNDRGLRTELHFKVD